ncbi:hypothetical protein EDC04DRAFT_2759390 [Pisolithus marmoratus]|nr:hypothetical protein EDC04DRAFT_2759390 [Pisolithus marmoratus]
MASIAAMNGLDIESLFPPPSVPPSALSPQRLPGASIESLAALQYVLKDNYQRWHIFLNDLKFHNSYHAQSSSSVCSGWERVTN